MIKATSDVTTARPMYHHLRLRFRPCLCESLAVSALVFSRELGTLDSGVLGVAVAACQKGSGTIERATRIRAPTVNVVHVVRILAGRRLRHSEKRKSAMSEQMRNKEVKEPRANRLCSRNRNGNEGEVWEEGKHHLGNVGAAESPWLVLRVPDIGTKLFLSETLA